MELVKQSKLGLSLPGKFTWDFLQLQTSWNIDYWHKIDEAPELKMASVMGNSVHERPVTSYFAFYTSSEWVWSIFKRNVFHRRLLDLITAA